MKRVIVRNKQEFLVWVNSFNGKMNCYTTVYDFEEYAETAKVDSTCIKDRMFLDFDAHGEPLTSAWNDFKHVMNILLDEEIVFKMYFSGKGFHMIVMGNIVNDIRSIQSSFSRLATDCPTLDRTGVQTNRLRRIPNTVNLSSEGLYFCIPLTIQDVTKGLLKLRKKKQIGYEIFNICSNKPVSLFRVINLLKNKIPKVKIKLRSMQVADVYKTHGDNRKFIKKTGKKFSNNFENSLNQTLTWFKKHKKIFI